MSDSQTSAIETFYSGKSIFITGVTGVCGRVFLEKVIRYLTQIETIFILIRPKRGLTVEERFKKLLSRPVFRHFEYAEEQLRKVIVIKGDVSEVDLGLNEADKQMLQEKVDVIFHVAASVRFLATFRENFTSNVIGTENVLRFAKTLKNISCFVHVSTAYSNCHQKRIEERLYPLPEDVQTLLKKFKKMSDQEMEIDGPKYFDGRPNSYIFTKAMAEHLVASYGNYFPIAIARPAIVVFGLSDPVPGFLDSLEGPVGLLLVVGLGILQVTDWDFHHRIEITPVDTLANALLCLGWKVSTVREQKPEICNVVTTPLRRLPDNYELAMYAHRVYTEKPSIFMIRPIYTPKRTQNMGKLEYAIKAFFYHTLFAYFIDFLMMLVGRKPIMRKTVNKMHLTMDVLKYFANNEWHFTCTNFVKLIDSLSPIDSERYNIDLRKFDIDALLTQGLAYGRRHILKEKDSMIKAARIKYQAMKILFTFWELFKLYILWKLFVILLTWTMPSQLANTLKDPLNCTLSSIDSTYKYIDSYFH